MMKNFFFKNNSFIANGRKLLNLHKPIYSCNKINFANVANVAEEVKVEEESEPEFLEMVQLYFDQASKYIDIPKFYLNLIKATKAAIKFNFPLVKDDGTIQTITGFRAQHSLHYLPTKGGTRYSDHIGNYNINLFSRYYRN